MGIINEDVLNLDSKGVKDKIEANFKLRIKNANDRARKDTNELRDGIIFYRKSSSEEIFASIDADAAEKFDKMSDGEALRNGLFQNIAEAYDRDRFFPHLFKNKRLRVIRKRIDEVIGTLDDESRARIIANYKVKNKEAYINSETKKCLSDAELFQNMTVEELNHYVDLFSEARKREYLYKARVAAVCATAAEVSEETKTKVAIPLSLRDDTAKETAETEANTIVDELAITDENKKLRTRILAKTKAVAKTTFGNANATALATAFSIAGGIGSGIVSDMKIADGSLFPVIAIATPLIFAGLAAAYYRIGRKDDKEAIEEYRKMGILQTMVDAETTKRELMAYDKQMRDKYDILIIEDGGNNNGLHK